MSLFVEITSHFHVSMNNIALSEEYYYLIRGLRPSKMFPFSSSTFSHMTNSTFPLCAFKEDT